MNSYKVYIYNNQNEIDCQVCLNIQGFCFILWILNTASHKLDPLLLMFCNGCSLIPCLA